MSFSVNFKMYQKNLWILILISTVGNSYLNSASLFRQQEMINVNLYLVYTPGLFLIIDPINGGILKHQTTTKLKFKSIIPVHPFLALFSIPQHPQTLMGN